MTRILIALIAAGFLLQTTAAAEQTDRFWISNFGGQYLEGKFVRVDGNVVVLRSKRGSLVEIDLADLSIEDQRLANQLEAELNSANNEPIDGEQLPPPRPVPDDGTAPAKPNLLEQQLKKTPKAIRTLQRILNAGENSKAGQPLFGEDSSVYIALSGDFLNRFIQIPFAEDRNVEDVILGTPVEGTAATKGVLSIQLLPNPKNASMEIVVNGEANSLTTGRQFIVDVHSNGTTTFEARKRIDIGEKGIGLYEASATANSQVNESAVTTPLQGRIGGLVELIAGSIVEGQRSEIDNAASERAAYRAAKDLDARVDAEVVRVQELLSDIAPGLAAGKPKVPVKSRTTNQTLGILVGQRVPTEWQALADEPKEATDGQPASKLADIVVVVPKETVNTAKRLEMAMQWLSISLEDQLGGIDPDELQPARSTWSEDREWLTLEWDVDATITELLSEDFFKSTVASPTPKPRRDDRLLGNRRRPQRRSVFRPRSE